MDNIKKAQKLIKFGQMRKDDIIIGRDEVDRKFKTVCGPQYTDYHNCLKSTYGDTWECSKQREKMEQCEVQNGFLKYDISEIKRKRQQLHGTSA